MLFNMDLIPVDKYGAWRAWVQRVDALMHKGVRQLLSEKDHSETRRELRKDLLVSLLYTLVILVLLKARVLKPFEHYFH